MNFVKKSWIKKIKGKIGALRKVRASKKIEVLLLSISILFIGPWGSTSLSCFLIGSAGRLL